MPSERVRRDVLGATEDNIPPANHSTKQTKDGGAAADDDDDLYQKTSTTENTIAGDSPGSYLLL